MKISKLFLTAAFLMGLGTLSSYTLAKDTVDAVDFVEEASASGIAEIETSKLALQKSASVDVKTFAQEMINDHTNANRELASIAAK